MSKQMKMNLESDKEEKIVFIVIGVIVLVAMAIVLIWYFTKGEEDTDNGTKTNPPVVNPGQKDEEDNKDTDKKDNSSIVVLPVEITLPSGIVLELVLGEEITINPIIVANGQSVLATVGIQKYDSDAKKWNNIVISGDKFIPQETGLYRYVYSYEGTVKYQNFTVQKAPVVWALPTDLVTLSMVNRVIVVNPNVLVDGQSVLADNLKVQKLEQGVWTTTGNIVNDEYIPTLKGQYRFVYTYEGSEKYAEFRVLAELEIASVADIDLSGVANPGDDRFAVITGNLSAMEVVDDNGYIIRVYKAPVMFDQTLETNSSRPLKTPAGLVITLDGFDGTNAIITSPTKGVYIDSEEDQKSLGINPAGGEILIWLDFNEFKYDGSFDIELDIDGDATLFTVEFKNFEIKPVAVIEDAVLQEITDPDEADFIEAVNDNIRNIDIIYNKSLLTITLLEDFGLDNEYIGLVVNYDALLPESVIDVLGATAYAVDKEHTDTWKALLKETEFIVWLNVGEITDSITIELEIDGETFEFTVEIVR